MITYEIDILLKYRLWNLLFSSQISSCVFNYSIFNFYPHILIKRTTDKLYISKKFFVFVSTWYIYYFRYGRFVFSKIKLKPITLGFQLFCVGIYLFIFFFKILIWCHQSVKQIVLRIQTYLTFLSEIGEFVLVFSDFSSHSDFVYNFWFFQQFRLGFNFLFNIIEEFYKVTYELFFISFHFLLIYVQRILNENPFVTKISI